MNAIDFLIKEHNRVRQLLTDISDDSHRLETKRELFDQLSLDLLRHEKMEQELWYPRFKNSLPDTVKHLVGEEKGAEKLIKKLDDLKKEDAWENNFSKFREEVEHHAEEEENELFPEVEKLLSRTELEEIGLEMYNFKSEHSKLKKN